MLKALEETISKLKDSRTGWVDRRDAALNLGQVIRRAQAVLDAHKNDKDTDVRAAVQRALGILRDSDKDTKADAAPLLSLEELVMPCDKPPKRSVSVTGDGFQVDVMLPNGRTQCVYLKVLKRQDGLALVHIHTYCGEDSPKLEHWALECNRKLARCAFALEKESAGGRLIVVSNQIMNESTPLCVKNAIKDVAHYGDWLEGKLSDEDVF